MAFLKGLCARYPVNTTQKIYAQYISVWYLERKHRKVLQKLQEKKITQWQFLSTCRCCCVFE